MGKLSGSISMVADGYHSLIDGANNVMGLVVTAFAYAPPDEGHPYGHRKFETAATLAIGLALLGVAFRWSRRRCAAPAARSLPRSARSNWMVMARDPGHEPLRGLVRGPRGPPARQRLPPGRRRPHAVGHLRDPGRHRLLRGRRARACPGWTALVALGIAAFIAVLAVQILVGSFHTLTDRAVILRQTAVERSCWTSPACAHCREIRTRGGPGAVYVDLIAHVDGTLTLREAHDVADRIEEAVQRAHPEIVDVVVHLEPAERRR